MPIYEFFCSECNTLFNFFSAVVDTTTRPACPRCGQRELERRPARFATLKHGGSEDEDLDPFSQLDDERLDGVMASMMGEMGELEENEDPRKLTGLVRRFREASGLEFGPKMEELMNRLEAGEDPDRLEEAMGGELDEDDSIEEFFRLKRRAWRRSRRPKIDETLYFL